MVPAWQAGQGHRASAGSASFSDGASGEEGGGICSRRRHRSRFRLRRGQASSPKWLMRWKRGGRTCTQSAPALRAQRRLGEAPCPQEDHHARSPAASAAISHPSVPCLRSLPPPPGPCPPPNNQRSHPYRLSTGMQIVGIHERECHQKRAGQIFSALTRSPFTEFCRLVNHHTRP